MTDLADLDALEARDRMARGEFSALDLCEACLRRIAEREPQVGAFAWLDADLARKQATACDDDRARGRATGPLHGLPVGVKDIVDTKDMPTENGTPLDAGRRPAEDAVIVSRLRAAGAVIMGKTVTTELGARTPRGTSNPHHREHTPGGSSSGSAAAVAAGMVPLAIGTQTNGSVIRPASFCGIVGLIADALAGYDPRDPDTRAVPPLRRLDAALADPPMTPDLAFVRTPAWERAEAATRDRFVELAEALSAVCEEVALPEIFDEGDRALRTLTNVGVARSYRSYYDLGRQQLSDYMRTTIEEGLAIPAVDYLDALDCQATLRAALDRLFDQYDAIVTPAAPGEAPRGLHSTGDSAFNNLWSLCGVPALTLPLLKGPNGLPLGVQLVGRRGEDAELLHVGQWLQSHLGG